MTQLEMAKAGTISTQMMQVARNENVEPDFILQGIADGTVVIPANPKHKDLKPCGIGHGLKTKVNANIGTSSDSGSIATEMEKLQVVINFKADAVMDLSTNGDLAAIRHAIIATSTIPVGTVPIYQAGIEAISRHGSIVDMTADELFRVIEQHAGDGVDFITVHCGVTQSALARLKQQGRVADIVSRVEHFCWGGFYITNRKIHYMNSMTVCWK